MTNLYRYISFLAIALLLATGCGSNKSASSKTEKRAPLSEAQRTLLMSHFMDGNKERVLGNNERAIVYFQECLKIDKNHSASHYELAKLYDADGQDGVALEHAKKAVEVDPTNEWYHFSLASIYEKSGQFLQSAGVFESLTKQKPQKVEYYYGWASALMYAGKYKEAVDVFDQIEGLIGVTEEVSIQKEKLYLQSGDTDKAVEELQRLIEMKPKEARYYSILGELYQNLGEEEKALEVYQQLLEVDPTDPMVQLSLYDYYHTKGEKGKALDILRKAFGNPGMDIDAKMQIMLSYYSAMERDPSLKSEAMTLNKILVETHPKDAKAYSIYGDFLYRDQESRKARENYRKAVELAPEKSIIWNHILIINSDLKDFESMKKESADALELFPNDPSFYFFNGLANSQLKEYEAAIESFESGAGLVFDSPELRGQFLSSLGDAYNDTKQYAKSDSCFDLAIEINPNNYFVLNNYSYYLSLRKEKLDDAAIYSKKCVDKEPNSATYLDTYAWILYQQQKFSEAKEWMEKALKNGGESSDIIVEHFGDILFQLNEKEKALDYWKKAKTLGPGSDWLDKKIETRQLHE